MANYGAGVYFNDSNSTLSLDNDSSISSNYAQKDGGGIYSNARYTRVFLTNNSSIFYNSAENGGGIYFNYTNFTLKSTDNTSSIYSNRARTGGGKGGALYICKNSYDKGSASTITNVGAIAGLEFSKNSSADDGGAIYIHQENVTISNCTIVNNEAGDEGGGIYNNNEGTTISYTTIKNNKSKSNGGGVFTAYDDDVTINGKVYITDNTRNDGSKDNLYLSDSMVVSGNAKVTGSPKGEIGIRMSNTHSDLVGRTSTYFIASVFKYDLSDNKHFECESDNDGKWLYLKDGAPQDKVSVTTVSPDAGTLANATYNGKKITKGYFSFLSVENSEADSDSVFFYSDGYFINGSDAKNGDPTVYNEHLASMSMAMATSAFYSIVGSDGSLSDSKNVNKQYGDRTYTYKSQNIKKLFTDIGIDQEDIFINDFNSVKPSTGSIGVAIGKKTIEDGSNTYTLVPIAIRGQGYEAEWASNVTVGNTVSGEKNKEEEGFAGAADQVFEAVEKYIEEYGLHDDLVNGRIKFWIAGYSRAGATSNLTAKRLVEAYCGNNNGSISNNQVYAYCFEAPQGGTNDAMTLDPSKYYCIHNCINKVDLVPLVAPVEMGFIRYGVDHYIPGSRASDVKETGSDSVWSILNTKQWYGSYKIWSDNESYEVGTTEYNNLKTSMLKQLVSVDPQMYFSDYFRIADFNLKGFVIGDILTEVECFAQPITQSEYLRIFWRALLDWSLYDISNAHAYRYSYVNSVGDTGSDDLTLYSFQDSLQTIIRLYFSKTTAEQSDITACLANGATAFKDGESYYDIYTDLLGAWRGLSQSKRQEWAGKFWNYFMTTYCPDTQSTAASYFTDDELSQMKSAFYTVIDIVLRMADRDYNTTVRSWDDTGTHMLDGITRNQYNYKDDKGISILCTLAYNLTSIAEGHYPEINFAWLRASDSFYENDTNTPIDIVTSKTPTVTLNESDLTKGNLTLKTDTTGSSIFYRLKKDNGKYSDWKPYNRTIDLQSDNDQSVKYTVQYSAIYCGNISDVVTKNITISGKYKVTVNGEDYGYYRKGERVCVSGVSDDDNKVFKSWNKDTNGVITDENINQANIIFEMPESNVDLTANYVDCVSNGLTLTVTKPLLAKH